MSFYTHNIAWPEPEVLAALVARQAPAVWLDSALTTHPQAKRSYLALSPVARLELHASGCGTLWQGGQSRELKDPWKFLEDYLRKMPAGEFSHHGFLGGVIGFLTYEAYGLDFKQQPSRHESDLPLVCFLLVDTACVLDHENRQAKIFSWGLEDDLKTCSASLARRRCDFLETALQSTEAVSHLISQNTSWTHCEDKNTYLQKINTIQEAIAAGDFYQVNFSQKFQLQGLEDAGALYLKLRQVSPAPQMAFLNLGDTQILSASPETLLEVHHGVARSYPIKGTRPRQRDEIQDQKIQKELLSSEKDAAELLMIVDLVRNDLGKVCELGSISVPSLKALQSFPQVHHLVAQVEGQLVQGVSPLQALRALFPGGSITGAPKQKAMEWIDNLENFPRGIFTGSLGFVSFNGKACFNIAIRTALLRKHTLDYFAGGGIVADSSPEAEYQESLDKARGMLEVLGIQNI